LAGINAVRLANGQAGLDLPNDTAMGALVGHLTRTDPKHFQPSNINFGLFPAPAFVTKLSKKLRGQHRAETALASLKQFCDAEKLEPA
jgi:methylenetetrahydrofolate--tRNA-(uracil-5-)-methyltransferase